MRRLNNLLILMCLNLLMLFTCISPALAELPDQTVKDGMFIHLTAGADNPHRVVMALKMATIFAPTHDVLVYCDIKGIEPLLKETDDITYSHFPSSQAAIKELLDKDVIIYACPGCLKAAGKEPSDLLEGIQIADKAKFFTFTKGRILTIDY